MILLNGVTHDFFIFTKVLSTLNKILSFWWILTQGFGSWHNLMYLFLLVLSSIAALQSNPTRKNHFIAAVGLMISIMIKCRLILLPKWHNESPLHRYLLFYLYKCEPRFFSVCSVSIKTGIFRLFYRNALLPW